MREGRIKCPVPMCVPATHINVSMARAILTNGWWVMAEGGCWRVVEEEGLGL